MTKLSQFDFQGNAVRVIMRSGEPWFVAHDVCAALDYVNSRKAVADHLDNDERSTVTNSDSRNGGGKLTIINESGLYALVLRSRKPAARKFAKWVTGEVLPSIRKTGQYSQQPQLPLQPTQDVELLAQRIAEAAIAHLQKPRESVNEQVERLAKQLAAPNGYGIRAFLPLWEVMSQKIGQMPWLWADHIRNKDNTFKAQMLTDLLFACNERLWELANLAETHVLVNPKTLK